MSKDGTSGAAAQMPWAHLRLPPFPQVAIRVLQLINNENVPLHQLCDLVSSDPAFSSEVLTIANSLLYAPRFPASTVMQAVAVLGARNLQGMCLTVGVRAYLGKALNLAAMRALWRHNLACAIIARQLAGLGTLDKEAAYTAGILHDVGRFGLSVIQPQEYAALLEAHAGTPASILEGERTLFGCDHCEAGERLVGGWMLAPDIQTIVSRHHAPKRSDGYWGMVELIQVSCRLADAAGFAAFKGCAATPYGELLDELPARERRLFHAELDKLAEEVGITIQAVESY